MQVVSLLTGVPHPKAMSEVSSLPEIPEMLQDDLEMPSPEEFVRAFRAAATDSREALASCLYLFWLLARPACRMGRKAVRVAAPVVRDAAVIVAARLAEQPREVIIGEAIALGLLLLAWRVRAFCQRRRYWPRFRAWTERRYALLARGTRRQVNRLAAALPSFQARHSPEAPACRFSNVLLHVLRTSRALETSKSRISRT